MWLANQMPEQVQQARERIGDLPGALRQDFIDLGLSDPAQHVAQALVARRLARGLLFPADEAPLRNVACPRLNRLIALLDELEASVVRQWGGRGWSEAKPRGASSGVETVSPLDHPGLDAASFYEMFLAACLPGERRRKGVFYTPAQVARFIVRQLNCVPLALPVQADSGSALAEPVAHPVQPVSVIDPAAGSGAFLTEFVRHAAGSGAALPPLTACELLPAACVVAQVRLTSVLRETGFARDEQLRIFWTNSLTEEQPAWRDRPYDVIVGNPPFGQIAPAVASWLRPSLEALSADVKAERNRQPLADATVKFLALACLLGQDAGSAFLGMVVNRTCFDGRLHGGLRRLLRETFPDLAVIDLGGETRAGPLAGRDQNVFDITQGVGILIGGPGEARVRAARLTGSREEKFAELNEGIAFRPLDVRDGAAWRFVPGPTGGLSASAVSHALLGPGGQGDRGTPLFGNSGKDIEAEYLSWPSLAELMPFRSPGVKTSCDPVAFAFTLEELEAQITAAGWDWDPARATRAVYRYGDVRWLYYDPDRLGRPRPELAKHVLPERTISLITMRQFIADEFSHLAVCRGLACHGVFYLGNRGQDYLFPLTLSTSRGRVPNLKTERLPESLRAPETFLHYAAAVMLSTTYRERYRDFLPHDFPRVPLLHDPALIDRLCELGHQWVRSQLALHADEPPGAALETSDAAQRFQVQRGAASADWQDIGNGQQLGPLSPEWFNARIGGSPVCRAFWKARRGRVVTDQDLRAFERLVHSLERTAELRAEVDKFVCSQQRQESGDAMTALTLQLGIVGRGE